MSFLKLKNKVFGELNELNNERKPASHIILNCKITYVNYDEQKKIRQN